MLLWPGIVPQQSVQPELSHGQSQSNHAGRVVAMFIMYVQLHLSFSMYTRGLGLCGERQDAAQWQMLTLKMGRAVVIQMQLHTHSTSSWKPHVRHTSTLTSFRGSHIISSSALHLGCVPNTTYVPYAAAVQQVAMFILCIMCT